MTQASVNMTQSGLMGGDEWYIKDQFGNLIAKTSAPGQWSAFVALGTADAPEVISVQGPDGAQEWGQLTLWWRGKVAANPVMGCAKWVGTFVCQASV